MDMVNQVCCKCQDRFENGEQMVNTKGEVWHTRCFVCGQCFQPFPDGVYYDFEGRKYCEADFNVLFAPVCHKCDTYVVGRVVKAMNATWHPHCFCCAHCNRQLADLGFVKYSGQALCHECHEQVKAHGAGRHKCAKCKAFIDENQHIRYRGEYYHPYHFRCANCDEELERSAREDAGQLYCQKCHDRFSVPICFACKRPAEERIVYALDRAWHIEHFVCCKCEKPFLGSRHYEKDGKAYCSTHYYELFGNICYSCDKNIEGDVFQALSKCWCVEHFNCTVCDKRLSEKTKFFEFDLKPVCKNCWEKFPVELRKRYHKGYETPAAK